MSGNEITILVVTGTDYRGSCNNTNTIRSQPWQFSGWVSSLVAICLCNHTHSRTWVICS